MAKKRKERLCRICKKRPVWIGGDVKNPGRVCKKCYHAHVWPERMVRRGQKVQGAATPEQKRTAKQKEPSKELRPIHGKRWKNAKRTYQLSSEELSMAHATNFTPIRMDQLVTGKRRSGKEKLPETATPEDIELVKRVIRERYAIYRKRDQERSGMAKLTALIPPKMILKLRFLTPPDQITARYSLGCDCRSCLASTFRPVGVSIFSASSFSSRCSAS